MYFMFILFLARAKKRKLIAESYSPAILIANAAYITAELDGKPKTYTEIEMCFDLPRGSFRPGHAELKKIYSEVLNAMEIERKRQTEYAFAGEALVRRKAYLALEKQIKAENLAKVKEKKSAKIEYERQIQRIRGE